MVREFLGKIEIYCIQYYIRENLGEIMALANSKEVILNAVRELPENASFEEAIEKLYLMSKIKKGINQADAGETISHLEAQQKLAKWLS